MQPVWTWGGSFFGYRTGDRLFNYHGKQVGRFAGDEIYSRNGHYLGEVRNNNRLITNKSKKNRRSSSFAPMRSAGIVRYVNYVGYVMYVGYEDFPEAESF